MDYALSNYDLSNFLLEGIKVLPYKKLSKYSDLDQIFGDSDCFITLLDNPKTPNIGHWVTVINSDNYVEYFDSTGRSPAGLQTLMVLLRSYGKPIIYNNYKLQKDKTNTCGRWVLARLLSRDVPIKDFIKMYANNKSFTPDQMVVRMIRLKK